MGNSAEWLSWVTGWVDYLGCLVGNLVDDLAGGFSCVA